MRIKRLELTNWGPHKKKTFDMNAGIVGILGANGKGKSNVLQAIDYALTGNLNKQKQEKYIRNYGQPDGASSAVVHLEFEKDGKTGSITRTITSTGSRRKLVWDDTEWTKAAEVETALETILGADKASLAQAVFIKQGELARIIKGTPAERQTLFQKLMNLSFIETRADDITSKICAIRGSLQDMRPALELALNDLHSCILNMQEYAGAIETSQKLRQVINTLVSYQAQLSKRDILAASLPELEKKKHNAYVELIAKQQEELKGSTIAELQAESHSCADSLAGLNVRLQECREYKAEVETRDKLQRLINELSETKKIQFGDATESSLQASKDTCESKVKDLKATYSLADQVQQAGNRIAARTHRYNIEVSAWRDAVIQAEDDLPACREQLVQIMQQLTELTVQIAYAEAKLSVFEAGGNTSVCPLCGSDMGTHTLMLPGESEADTKARLAKECEDLHATKISTKSTIDHLTAHIISCENTLKLPDPEIAFNNDIRQDLEFVLQHDMNNTLSSADLNVLQTEIAAAEKELNISSVALLQYTSLERDLKEYTAKLSNMTATLPYSGPDETALLEAIQAVYATKTTIDSHIATLKNLEQAAELAAQNYTQAVDALRSIEETECKPALEAIEADEYLVEIWLSIDLEEKFNRNSYVDVGNMIQAIRELQTESDQEVAKYEQLKQRKEELQTRVQALQLEVNKNEDKQRLIDDLNVVKSMISRTGVPLAFMNDVFNKLVGLVQDMLVRMGSNFTVIPDPERACSFLFTRTDNDSAFEMQQEQLSGGQAIRLALALLLACQQIILPDVGLLILDEPSSHIDSEGVEQMRDLFLSLQQLLQNTNMQLIIVDHNDKLTTSFETTIVL